MNDPKKRLGAMLRPIVMDEDHRWGRVASPLTVAAVKLAVQLIERRIHKKDAEGWNPHPPGEVKGDGFTAMFHGPR